MSGKLLAGDSESGISSSSTQRTNAVESQVHNVDARGSTTNNVGRDQYNLTFNRRFESWFFHSWNHIGKLTSFSVAEKLSKSLKPSHIDTVGRTACLQGTRTKIIESIINWGTDISSEQNILWLYGLAGSGKSTISTTVADHFHEIGILGAYIFFDRKFAQESHPTAVIRTLAYQLSLARPGVATAISAIIDITPTISALSIQRQFQQLLLDPLLTEGTIEADKPLILVLDAFDECGTVKEREDLLEQLAERSTKFPRNIRIFITSRPEKDIRDAFELQSHILVQELDVTSDANVSDISSYFRHCMARIRKKNKSLLLGVDWPGEDDIQKLTERASGLFVWASTASEFVNGHDPRIRLGIILGGDPMREAESALDYLYQTALLSAGSWDDADFVADFRDILGLVLVARTPLSSAAIDALLCTAHGRPSIHTIGLLGCVLSAGPTVRVLHPSFADFLSNRTRCGREIWHIDPPAFHERLLRQCLDRLDLFLKRNMCNLSLSHDELSASLPDDIAYACVHWIDHLDMICVAPMADLLVAFLNRHLLHWFESMTILEGARTTVSLLNRLSQAITVSCLATFFTITHVKSSSVDPLPELSGPRGAYR